MPARARHPDWDRLYETAAAQEGLFTTKQGAEAGYSPQLLAHHVEFGKVARVRRGIYRVVHFPAGEHEELVVAWLWSGLEGVVSHQSALALHDLSDVLPSKIHLTLPDAWSNRRFRVPRGIVLHYAHVPRRDRGWLGPVPVTTPRRTLDDCAAAALAPELLHQAAEQALRRGLVTKRELTGIL